MLPGGPGSRRFQSHFGRWTATLVQSCMRLRARWLAMNTATTMPMMTSLSGQGASEKRTKTTAPMPSPPPPPPPPPPP